MYDQFLVDRLKSAFPGHWVIVSAFHAIFVYEKRKRISLTVLVCFCFLYTDQSIRTSFMCHFHTLLMSLLHFCCFSSRCYDRKRNMISMLFKTELGSRTTCKCPVVHFYIPTSRKSKMLYISE